MPITQEQMLRQIVESRAAHAEFRKLYNGLLQYCISAKNRYPTNPELQETFNGLEYILRTTQIPDDRETYLNEQYYARFGRRNAKAKEKQAMIRAGLITPEPRQFNMARKQRAEAPHPQGAFTTKARTPIMPRTSPDDKPLEFDTMQNDLNSPGIGLDIPPDAYDNAPSLSGTKPDLSDYQIPSFKESLDGK